MNEPEQLYAQYEDAFFALVMHRIAEAEGERLLEINRQLQADPDAAVPEELTKRCLRLIRQHSGKVRRKKTIRQTARVLSRVAVAVLISILLFVSVCAIYEPLRVKTLNYIIEELSNGTAFSFSDHSPQTDFKTMYTALALAAKHAPKEYQLTQSAERKTSAYYLFESEDGSFFRITGYSYQNADMDLLVDTEDAVVDQIELNTQQIMTVQKGNEIQLLWINKVSGYVVLIWGADVPLEVLVDMMEITVS